MIKRYLSVVFNIFTFSKQKPTIESVLKIYSDELASSKEMQKIVPRQFQKQDQLKSFTSTLNFSKTNNHLSSLTNVLSNPIWDLLDRGGKRWRPILCMLIAELYGHKRCEVFQIAALCEILHNGTLMIDDLEDSRYDIVYISTIRRNLPCTHLLFGVDVAVNAGNFMYFAPILKFMSRTTFNNDQKVKFYQIYCQEMTNLHIGQSWDISWHNVSKLQIFPNESQYLQMTAHKTGVMARLAARMVCAYINLSDEETKVIETFVEAMGVAFQIQDDLLNLEGQQFKKTKGYNGEDIHEGKISLMVIHFLQNADEKSKKRLLSILQKKTDNLLQIQEAINLLRSTDSLAYARKRMNQLIQSAWKQCQKSLPENEAKQLLYELLYFGIKRNR